MKFTTSHKLIALAAISAILSACGGGGSAGGSALVSVNSQVTAAPAKVALGQSFSVTGVAISKPSLMATTAWSVAKLTTGAPDLTITNGNCAVAVKANETVNATSATPTSLSTWTCSAVLIAPLSLVVDSLYRVTYLGTDALGNTGSDYRDFTISSGAVGPVATPPVATTTPAVSVASGAAVDLNCLASGGTVAASSAYRVQWVVKANPAALSLSLTNPTAQDVAFKAPSVSNPTDVSFECRVTDDKLLTSVADTVVTINPSASVTSIANAGGSQSTTPGSLVTLNASASTPFSGIYYTWTQTGGPAVSLASANSVRPTFVAPAVSTSTHLTFKLIAQATFGTTATAAPSEVDTTDVYVNPQAALILAMTPSSVVKSGVAVAFSVGVTPLTNQLFYEWSEVSGPSVTMGGANTSTTSFVAPTVASATPMVFSVKVSRSPIATANPSEIYSSDVAISVTP